MSEAHLRPWRALFDRAQASGRPTAVWWRDDDAVEAGPRLGGLLAEAARVGAVVAVAAIPAAAQPSLLRQCEDAGATLWQHGVRHADHQRLGRSAELGSARPVEAIVRECLDHLDRLASPAFRKVMVPPWNRMREDLAPALAAAGYEGLSRFGGPPLAEPLARLDTHLDPVAWRSGRGLVAPAQMARQAEHAAAAGGPLGLLTHHMAHSDDVGAFVAAFAALVRDHPGARWVAPDAALREARNGADGADGAGAP